MTPDELRQINDTAREAQESLAKLDDQRRWITVDLPFAFNRVVTAAGRMAYAVQQLGLKADEPHIVDGPETEHV